VPRYLSDVARNIENMLKDQPEFSIEVARFQKHHELLYARKLSASQYGFAKLSDLLNFLPDVKLQGSGIAMQAVLSNAVVVFAHQARRVLEGEPGKRLTGCKFAAAFHQTHNRQVKVAEYGYSKLKELVHAVPETLRVVEDNGQYFIELIDGNAEPDPHVRVLKYPYCTEPCSANGSKTTEPCSGSGSKTVSDFATEARELLESCPGQCVSFAKFTAAYNQYFKRQCRVADYGYTKLAFLIKAVPETLQLIERDEGITVCLATDVPGQDCSTVSVEKYTEQESHDSDVVVEASTSSDENDESEGGEATPALASPPADRQSSWSLMDFDSVPTADILRLSSPSPAEPTNESLAESLTILDHPIPDLSTLPLLGDGDTTLETLQERSDNELMAELSQELSACSVDKIDVTTTFALDVPLISLETPPSSSPLTKHRESVTSLLDEPSPRDLTAALLDTSNNAVEGSEKWATQGTTKHTNSNQSSTDGVLDGFFGAEVDGSASLASRLVHFKRLESLDVDTAIQVSGTMTAADVVPTLCESKQKRRLNEKVSVEEKLASLMIDNAEQLMVLESKPPTILADTDGPSVSNDHTNAAESSNEEHDANVDMGAVEIPVAVDVSSDSGGSADFQWEAAEKTAPPKTKTFSKPPTSRFLAANFSMAPASLLSESQK
jgi:hypothetical protein